VQTQVGNHEGQFGHHLLVDGLVLRLALNRQLVAGEPIARLGQDVNLVAPAGAAVPPRVALAGVAVGGEELLDPGPAVPVPHQNYSRVVRAASRPSGSPMTNREASSSASAGDDPYSWQTLPVNGTLRLVALAI
jgi:hypothetical protein